MSEGAGDPQLSSAARLAVAHQEFDAQARRFEQARARLQATFDKYTKGRRELLRQSALARLQAQVETMPVIEQAKGILMAQRRCGPDEAFDLLRRASQRANIKVIVLAKQMVEQIAAPDPDSTGQDGTPGQNGGIPGQNGGTLPAPSGRRSRTTRLSGRR